MFNAESRLVLDALGDNAITAHHIGSTAIPAVVAKPVIDMLIVVADIALVDTCNTAMQRIGYEVMGEYGISARRYFRKDNDAGIRTHHVHVFAQRSPHVKRHLAFRDFMNAHPQWAAEYSELKRELAAKHPESNQHYYNGKSDFITSIDKLAAAWNMGEQCGEPEPPMTPDLKS
jgi:GrpB-like predicted nucleotidyltransferase (UPF0157 family)